MTCAAGVLAMRRGLCAAALTLAAGLSGGFGTSSADATATNFTWTGQAGTELWSGTGNWQAGVAPSGTVGTLTFPALTCTPTAVCVSQSDVESVSVGTLDLDDASGYVIHPLTASDSAEALAIGSGGLNATTQATTAPGGTPALGPVTFSGAEAWTVNGGPAGIGALTVGQITGASSGVGTGHVTAPSLGLHLSNQGRLTLAGNGVDNELGALTVTGTNSSDTGAAAIANGTIGFTTAGGALNSVNRSQVTLNDVALIGAATLGPLSATGSFIGFAAPNSVGTTQVDGNASFGGGTLLDLALIGSGSSTPAGNDYAQLSVTGHITLNGVALQMVPGSPRCPSLRAGDVDSIVTAGGGISGTFTGLPNSTQVTLSCVGQQPTIRINYNSTTVTATVLSSGGPAYPTVVALSGPAKPPTAGQSMQLSATVAPNQTGAATEPTGTLTFSEDGLAIPSCASRPLSASGSTVSAVCSLAAPGGAHNFAATYTPSTTDWATSASTSVSISPILATPATASPTQATSTPATPTPTTPTIPTTATARSTTATESNSTPAGQAQPVSPVMRLTAVRDPADPQLLSDTATFITSNPRAGTVSGQITFSDGVTPIPGCTAVPLNAGRASCETGFQTLGPQVITAVYSGSSIGAVSAHATVYSSLAAPTASFSHFGGRTPALSLTVRSPQAPFTGYHVQFLTPGISFDSFAALMSSSGRLSVAHGSLALGLAHPAAVGYFQLGTGALKLTRALPTHGAILVQVTLTFAHRPSAELLLSIPR